MNLKRIYWNKSDFTTTIVNFIYLKLSLLNRSFSNEEIILKQTTVFISCSGLGLVNRGYETFSRELFEVLSNDDELEIYLLKGAGDNTVKEKKILNIPRFSNIGKMLGKLFGVEPYLIEQLSFSLASVPMLLLQKPQVILYSDFHTGIFYWHIRKFLGLKYKLLFSNGAPNGPPFTRCDYVQQLLPFYKKQALDAGEDSSKHFVLPYAISPPAKSLEERAFIKSEIKNKLGLKGTVVLCVAAINDSHKRITYLIDEVAAIKSNNITLVVLGQQNEESDAIIRHGNELMGSRFSALTLAKDALEEYYTASDVFILPSLSEGLPRVMLEALSFGLPVLSHDYPVSRDVLKKFGYFADFSIKSSLSGLLLGVLSDMNAFSVDMAFERSKYIQLNFSWTALKKDYRNMINSVANA